MLGRDSVQVPDDQDFRSFRSECEAEAGWNLTYSKAGVSVWVQAVEMDRALHKIKVGLPYPTCSLHCALAASDKEFPGPPAGPQTPGCAPRRKSPVRNQEAQFAGQAPITEMGQLRPGEGA